MFLLTLRSLSRPNKLAELRREPCEPAEADADDDLVPACANDDRYQAPLSSSSPEMSFAGPHNSLALLQPIANSPDQDVPPWQCASPVLDDADLEEDSETDALHPVEFVPFTMDGLGNTAAVPSCAESRVDTPSKPRRPLLVDAKGMQQLFGSQKGGPQGQAASTGNQQYQRHGGFRDPSQGRRGGGASPGQGPRAPLRKRISPVPSPASCKLAEKESNKDAVLDMLATTWITAGGLDDSQAGELGLDREASGAPPDPVNAEHVDQLLELFPQLTRDMALLMIRVRRRPCHRIAHWHMCIPPLVLCDHTPAWARGWDCLLSAVIAKDSAAWFLGGLSAVQSPEYYGFFSLTPQGVSLPPSGRGGVGHNNASN